ncbi:hypothetical protein C3L33_16854, partial [Rhododendron williamsianum]
MRSLLVLHRENGTPVNIIVGSHVWAEDPALAWIDGQVLKINGAEADIQTSNGKTIVAKLQKIYPKDMEAPAGGVDDMTKLSYLHEPGVLQNLKSRYELNEIYTYTGNILIAINPFQRLPHLYDAHMMQQYKGAPFGELSPHVFAVADVAYSRFGKFVEIQFDKHGRISGAAIRTYLLERSRVCQISDPERNYHCFYLLCAAPQEEIDKYKLGSPKTFHYLNQSKCYELGGVSDAHDYLATRRAMDVVGIILHIGNIDFAKGKEIDSSVPKDDKSKFHLQTTAELLMCDPVGLEDALCKRVMITPEEVIKRCLDPLSALVSRDGLAKTLYSRLFDWLVDKINKSIGQDPTSKSLIGVLDIYGFESFKHNSFEQFCINFTNEKLQQHFNQKPGGIVALLDEACMFPKSTHETFSNKLYQTFKTHKRFVKPKLSRTDFTISHYAGEVQYQSDQFLDKNKDYVVPEHQDLLGASKCSFVAGLFPPIAEESSKSSKFSSIGSRFKLQLQQLMETLNATEPHYIRCVKPNNLLKPAVFENVNIMQQLRCGGVLEAIRISCAGYPTRRPFFEFINRFGLLATEVLEGHYDEKVACQKILEKKGLKGFQVGKTKVFLRAGQMAELDARRAEVLSNAAKAIQRRIRTHIARRQFIALRMAAIDLQSLSRGRIACKIYKGMRREAAALKFRRMYTDTRRERPIKDCRSQYLSYKQAARETGALKEAKDKLEKNVEELTWRLQLEKRLRTDLEEAKAQEIVKLQNSLQAMQSKIDETNALLVKEREASRKVIEEAPPVIKETQVFVEDTKKVELLMEEINSLKALLQSEKQKSDDLGSKYSESQEVSEERGKKLEETEKRVHQLQESLSRLEEKLTNIESENKVLRQQALSMAPNKILSGRSRSILQRGSESGHLFVDTKTTLDLHSPSSIQRDLSEVEDKPQKSLNEKQQENQELLIRCIVQHLDSPEADRLLPRTLKASGAAGMAPQRRRSSSATLFGRMTQSFRGAPQGVNLSFANGGLTGGTESLRQVEAKYPALLFKQQLTAYVEKIYGMIRDNLKKEISPLLGLCIQAPRTSRASLVKGSSRSVANTAAQQALIAHWQGIVKSLGNFLNTLKTNHVPPFLVRKIMVVPYGFDNVFVTAAFYYGENVVRSAMVNMSKLDWLNWNTGVIHQKPKKTLDEISHDLCPVLSIQQLYRISTMYWDDKYGTHSVSSDVISSMRVLMTEDSNNAVSNSFLLDDDSSIPFSVDDISKSMEQIDISDIEPPPLIRDNSGFSFLLPRSD